jgi:hypothetical protein
MEGPIHLKPTAVEHDVDVEVRDLDRAAVSEIDRVDGLLL